MYPIPDVEEAFKILNGSIIFSSMDVASMYWQIGMEEEDKEKTSFILPFGKYEFNVMPFGLKNAPFTAARAMDAILGGLSHIVCFNFFDDILVFSENTEEHLKRLRLVFERLRKFNLKLKPEKCEFLKTSINFLGNTITRDGLTPDKEKIKAALKLKKSEPKNCKDAKSLLGFFSFNRRFIKDFARIAYPIITATKEFVWEQDQITAVDKLVDLLTKEPILGHFDTKAYTELRTDACDLGLGAILCQRQDNVMKNIAFASRILSKCEKNYTITEKECLAVVWSVEKLRDYLKGRLFTIITDHCSLC